MDNLRKAHENARKRKEHYKEVKMVDANPDYYLKQIQEMLINGTYEVSEYHSRIIKDKGKERELMILPYFPDRIIQWAIVLRTEEIFKKTFCYHTCASIAGRGGERARVLVKRYLRDKEGTKYCLKMDVRKFYPNINKEILKKMLRRKFKDNQLLELFDKIIDSYPKCKGIPIGSYLSQYFANFYLSYFDHWIKEDLGFKYVIRYMDDVVLLCDSKKRLHEARVRIQDFLKNKLDLELRFNYQIFPVRFRGIDFVGFRFFHDFVLLRKRLAKRFKDISRKILRFRDCGKVISYKLWCAAHSYIGWLRRSDCYRFWQWHLKPIWCKLAEYHDGSIKNKDCVVFIRKCNRYAARNHDYRRPYGALPANKIRKLAKIA